MKISELNAIRTEIAMLCSGKLAPSRAWKLEKLPDGSVRRNMLKPEAEKEAARLALDARAALKVTSKDFAPLLGVGRRRKPTGAALTLLRVARSNPRAVMKAVSASCSS